MFTGTIQDAVEYVKSKPNSTISAKEKESEGLVGRPLVEIKDRRGDRVIVKVKVRDFE